MADCGVPHILVIPLACDCREDDEKKVGKQDTCTYPRESQKQMLRYTQRSGNTIAAAMNIARKRAHGGRTGEFHKPKHCYPAGFKPYTGSERIVEEDLHENEGNSKHQTESTQEGEVDIDLQRLA